MMDERPPTTVLVDTNEDKPSMIKAVCDDNDPATLYFKSRGQWVGVADVKGFKGDASQNPMLLTVNLTRRPTFHLVLAAVYGRERMGMFEIRFRDSKDRCSFRAQCFGSSPEILHMMVYSKMKFREGKK